MAGKGGGAWKVAYADFVTAMMAFFMVMWITAQSGKVKEAIAQHFKGPKDPFRQSKLFNSLNPVGTEKQSKKQYTKSRGFSISESPDDPDSIRPRLGTNRDSERAGTGIVVFFSEESAELDSTNRERLEEFTPAILGKPQKIEIRGHATRRPLAPDSSFRDSWQLSFARCQAVLNFLEERGVPLERIRLSQAGRYEPATLKVDPAWQARNSRVEIQMLNEVVRDTIGNGEEPID